MKRKIMIKNNANEPINKNINDNDKSKDISNEDNNDVCHYIKVNTIKKEIEAKIKNGKIIINYQRNLLCLYIIFSNNDYFI